MFKLSASGRNLHSLPKSPPINNAWSMTVRWMLDQLSIRRCLNSHRHLAKDVDRPASVALPRFCNPENNSVMLGSHALGAAMKSGVSRRNSSTAVRARSAGVQRCWNLRWYSAFDSMNNMKYACDKKFIEVYVRTQKVQKSSVVLRSYCKESGAVFFYSRAIK